MREENALCLLNIGLIGLGSLLVGAVINELYIILKHDIKEYWQTPTLNIETTQDELLDWWTTNHPIKIGNKNGRRKIHRSFIGISSSSSTKRPHY